MELGLHDRLQRAERDGEHSTGSPPVTTFLLWPKQELVEKKISVRWIPRKELMTSFFFFSLLNSHFFCILQNLHLEALINIS